MDGPRENADIFEEIKRLGWQFRSWKANGIWVGDIETPAQVTPLYSGTTVWVVLQCCMTHAAGLPVDHSKYEALYGRNQTYLLTSAGVAPRRRPR